MHTRHSEIPKMYKLAVENQCGKTKSCLTFNTSSGNISAFFLQTSVPLILYYLTTRVTEVPIPLRTSSGNFKTLPSTIKLCLSSLILVSVRTSFEVEGWSLRVVGFLPDQELAKTIQRQLDHDIEQNFLRLWSAILAFFVLIVLTSATLNVHLPILFAEWAGWYWTPLLTSSLDSWSSSPSSTVSVATWCRSSRVASPRCSTKLP